MPQRIVLSGDYDLNTTDAMQAQLTDALEQSPDGLLLVDMSNVSFLDTAAWRAISNVAKEAARRNGRVILQGTTSHQRRILDILGFQDDLAIDDPA